MLYYIILYYMFVCMCISISTIDSKIEIHRLRELEVYRPVLIVGGAGQLQSLLCWGLG